MMIGDQLIGGNDKGLSLIAISFDAAGGTSTPDGFQGGGINTITHAGSTGVYAVDLLHKDKIQKVVAWGAAVLDSSTGEAAADHRTATVYVDETAAAGCTVRVITRQNDVPTDMADGRRICLWLLVRTSDSAYVYA